MPSRARSRRSSRSTCANTTTGRRPSTKWSRATNPRRSPTTRRPPAPESGLRGLPRARGLPSPGRRTRVRALADATVAVRAGTPGSTLEARAQRFHEVVHRRFFLTFLDVDGLALRPGSHQRADLFLVGVAVPLRIPLAA